MTHGLRSRQTTLPAFQATIEKNPARHAVQQQTHGSPGPPARKMARCGDLAKGSPALRCCVVTQQNPIERGTLAFPRRKRWRLPLRPRRSLHSSYVMSPHIEATNLRRARWAGCACPRIRIRAWPIAAQSFALLGRRASVSRVHQPSLSSYGVASQGSVRQFASGQPAIQARRTRDSIRVIKTRGSRLGFPASLAQDSPHIYIIT